VLEKIDTLSRISKGSHFVTDSELKDVGFAELSKIGEVPTENNKDRFYMRSITLTRELKKLLNTIHYTTMILFFVEKSEKSW
jgi:hypothetical protein